MMNVVDRVKAPTPIFFKVLRSVGWVSDDDRSPSNSQSSQTQGGGGWKRADCSGMM